MTFSQVVLGVIGLLVLCCLALCWLCWHLAYKDGYNDGRDYERSRRYLRALRDNSKPGDPRASALPAAPRPPWYQPVPPRPAVRRVVTTAGTVLVTVVPVGPSRIPLAPQPSRISGAGTVPFRASTVTGEFRALTDDYIADLQARGERDRQELTS